MNIFMRMIRFKIEEHILMINMEITMTMMSKRVQFYEILEANRRECF